MLSFISNVVAGAVMSIQGVMNTRLNEKVGLFEANAYVQGTAFLISLLVAIFFGKGNIKEITSVPWYYLLGGVLGMVITVTVMLGIGKSSPTVAISIILISQLITAALIDGFGIMETPKVPFKWTQILGVALMIGGVIVFKNF